MSATLVQAETYRYQYFDLSQAKFPPGYSDFWTRAIDDSGRVYGITFTDSPYGEYAAIYDRGVVTVFGGGIQFVRVNEDGTVGGDVKYFDINGRETFQAAFFRGSKIKLIPRHLPGEVDSFVVDLNDDGTALVESYDADFSFLGYSLYKKGRFLPLDFGSESTLGLPPYYPLHKVINNEGTIIGQVSGTNGCSRGFRYDSNTGKRKILNPLPTGECSSAWDINNRGYVLGGVTRTPNFGEQHIGLWDKKGIFHTYLVEGTPEFPGHSYSGMFNDNNLIVTGGYLLPKPGVRLNVADLVVNPPSLNWKPGATYAINNKGDMVGVNVVNSDGTFYDKHYLLKRIDAKTRVPAASTTPAAALAPSVMASNRLAVPPQVAAFRRSQMHRLMSKSGLRRNAFQNLKPRP